jgi:hypothetical protein
MTRNRLFVAVVASIAASLSAVAAFAQSPKPSPSPAGKMGKMAPARDPKTGKFVKGGGKMSAMSGKKGGSVMGKTGGKKTPPRDPKTGRFVKASPAPAKKP